VQQIARLHRLTSIALLGPDDLLVLKKDAGQVMRVVNDTLLSEPLLDVNVAIETERGMLDIAIKNIIIYLPTSFFILQSQTRTEMINVNRLLLALLLKSHCLLVNYFFEKEINLGTSFTVRNMRVLILISFFTY
jgi:hypothetical protein